MLFQNRSHAGKELAAKLSEYSSDKDTVVLALPRGGVPVGYEISRILNLPLDVFLVRKLGVPGHEELAMGAIASGGSKFINDSVINSLSISEKDIEPVIEKEQKELKRREAAYRNHLPQVEIKGKKVILVDDGLATGSTMFAAISSVKLQNPKEIIVAVPVAPPSTVNDLINKADKVISLNIPDLFFAVGQWYQEFGQTSDVEVCVLLEESRKSLKGKSA